jgi:hypothetical protein
MLKPTGSRVRCSKCGEIFKAFPPDIDDRRKHQRFKTQNLISHVTYDLTGRLIFQGLGKALDLSKGGMLIETTDPIGSGLISLTATDAQNQLIEIDGNVVYCKESSSGKYLSGISFISTDEQMATFVSKLLKEYSFQKKEILFLTKQD